MESSLEICNGCGKVPRSLDLSLGSFSCSRCGHKQTISVSSDEYERVIFNLERSFHEALIRKRLDSVMSSPAYLPKKARKLKPASKHSSKTISSKKKSSVKNNKLKSSSKKRKRS